MLQGLQTLCQVWDFLIVLVDNLLFLFLRSNRLCDFWHHSRVEMFFSADVKIPFKLTMPLQSLYLRLGLWRRVRSMVLKLGKGVLDADADISLDVLVDNRIYAELAIVIRSACLNVPGLMHLMRRSLRNLVIINRQWILWAWVNTHRSLWIFFAAVKHISWFAYPFWDELGFWVLTALALG